MSCAFNLFLFFFSLLCECHRFWKIKYDATGQETVWSILYAVQKHFVWCVLVCVRWVWVAVVLKSCVLQKHGLIHTAPLCVLWSNLLSWPLFFFFNLCYAACCWMLYQTRSTTCRHTMFFSLHICFSGSLEPVKPRSSLRDQFRSILAGFGKFQSFKHKIVAKMFEAALTWLLYCCFIQVCFCLHSGCKEPK